MQVILQQNLVRIWSFSIIINNYSGSSKNIISGIEENIRELIMNN